MAEDVSMLVGFKSWLYFLTRAGQHYLCISLPGKIYVTEARLIAREESYFLPAVAPFDP